LTWPRITFHPIPFLSVLLPTAQAIADKAERAATPQICSSTSSTMTKTKIIDFHELKAAMKALGFDLPKSEILTTLKKYSVLAAASTAPNAMGAAGAMKKAQTHPTHLWLSLAAFRVIMSQHILTRDPSDQILHAFELFDEGAKGKITLQDLRREARELGVALDEEELVAMIEEFDLDGGWRDQ